MAFLVLEKDQSPSKVLIPIYRYSDILNIPLEIFLQRCLVVLYFLALIVIQRFEIASLSLSKAQVYPRYLDWGSMAKKCKAEMMPILMTLRDHVVFLH